MDCGFDTGTYYSEETVVMVWNDFTEPLFDQSAQVTKRKEKRYGDQV
jgi:hypothetical protein